MSTPVGSAARSTPPESAQPVSSGGPDHYLAVFGPAPFRLRLIFLLLLVSSVAWRKGAFYDGGLDVVVVAKAGLLGFAFLLALTTPRSPEAWTRFRAAPVLWVAGYLGVTMVGALLHDSALATGVLAVRIALLTATLVLVVLSFPFTQIVPALTGSMLLLVTFGAATGYSSIPETGRLYGGIPPLNANEICFLVSVPAVFTLWRCVDGRARRGEYAALLAMLGVIWMTGARTGLAALVVAFLLVVVLSPRVSTVVTGAAGLALPVVVYLTFFTSVVLDFAGRGDFTSVTTLNSRTVAWAAALDYPQTTAEHLLGFGIALKEIPVTAAYRTSQILDSTWISALLQVGLVGTALLALLVLSAFVAALRMRRIVPVVVPLLTMMTMTSVLESGLLDTTPTYILFLTLALVVQDARPTRE